MLQWAEAALVQAPCGLRQIPLVARLMALLVLGLRPAQVPGLEVPGPGFLDQSLGVAGPVPKADVTILPLAI